MRLFLANFNMDTTERQVRKFFDGYGQVTSVALKGNYGFVDDRDAEDAMKDLQGRALNGMNVHIELAHNRGPGSQGAIHRKTENRLLIRNLSTTCDWKELKTIMSNCGRVSYVKAHDRKRNVGYVCFESHADVLTAIEKYQGAEINGRSMQLIDMSDQAIGNQRSASPSRAPSVVEVSSSPSRSQRDLRGRSRAPIHDQSSLRRVPSSASPDMRRVKRHHQPSLSPSRSIPHAKRRREEGSEVVTLIRAMTDAVQMLIDRVESVENSVREMTRKQIEMQRDLRDNLKRAFAPEKLDRRDATLPWEASKASFLPTMPSSELPMPVERERRGKTSRAVPTRGHNDERGVQETGAIKERGGDTKRTAGQEMPRIRPYGGQHRQERDERTRGDYHRGEENRLPKLPPVGRGGGIVGKSKGRPVFPRAFEPATQLQPGGWNQQPFGQGSINGNKEGAARAKPEIESNKPQQTSRQTNAEEMPGAVPSRSM